LPSAPVISIIVDDEFVRTGTERLVRSLRLVPVTFASAEDFLDSPYLDTTSCVIADVQMPGMTGLELQRALLAQGKPVPVIFITAFPDEQIRARALAAGALEFLSKPFECATLIRCLNKAVEMQQPKG
jgi:FixJ family two-component response regulator